MSQAEVVNICYLCKVHNAHLLPCHFCKRMICPKHAHYLPTKEVTIHGVRNDVVRVCPECTPKHRI